MAKSVELIGGLKTLSNKKSISWVSWLVSDIPIILAKMTILGIKKTI